MARTIVYSEILEMGRGRAELDRDTVKKKKRLSQKDTY